MRRVIYSLAILPFIAYGVKIVHKEDRGAEGVSLVQEELITMVAISSGSQDTVSKHDEKVKQSLSPLHQQTYDHLSDDQKGQVNDAFYNAPNGKEKDNAHKKMQGMMKADEKNTSQDSGVQFEDSNSDSPFHKSLNKNQKQKDPDVMTNQSADTDW